MTFPEYCWWGLLAHIVADWFLQNHWMQQKVDIKHPAAWVHSGLHFLCFLPAFGWLGAFGVFVTHILIDTRKPLEWWRRLIKQSTPEQAGPAFLPFAFLQDQMAHIMVIIVASWLLSR